METNRYGWRATLYKPSEMRTHLGTVFGFAFYEDPELGEDAPILAVKASEMNDPKAIVWNTWGYEIPDYL